METQGLIRAIAVDIDGTLTDESRVVCPDSVQAIRRLRIPVILVTGNTHCFTRTMAIALGTSFAFIAENGGVVSYSDKDMEILADLSACESAYQELNKSFQMHRHDSRYRFTDITLERDFDVLAASKLIEELRLPVELVDTGFAVHIKDKSVNKGTGLLRIADRLGISLEEFAAVGDSISDIPMFNLAGFRASVGNADPQLKAISDYVAKSKYGSGFAEIVEFMKDQKIC
jgi:phosphoglycolate phosphatase (TIGR01487 family)